MHQPLLVGRLIGQPDDSAILVGAPDSVRHVNSQDHTILKRFDGHSTSTEIARALGIDPLSVRTAAERHAGPRYVMELHDWNKLHWDPVLKTYINTSRADAGWPLLPPEQQERLHVVDIAPPCDPWICLDAERAWIATRLTALSGRHISGDAFFLCNNGLRDGVFFWQVVLDGEVVAKITFKGKDETEWEWKVFPALEKIDLAVHQARTWRSHCDDLLEANRRLHARLVKDTVAFIKVVCEQSPGQKPLVYFSGGKESIVTADLFQRAGRSAQLLFAATGLDFDEDNSFIRECEQWIARDETLARLFRLHIEEADASASEQMLRDKGELGPKDMWCRSQVKYPVRSRAVQKLYPDGVPIAFEGSRWYETDFRRGHPRINEVQDISGYSGNRQRWAHALADWNGIDIWTHIFENDLPVNPLYRKGFQRTTCWMCPLIVPFHTAQSKRLNPVLWARIEGVELKGLDQAAAPTAKPLPL